MGTSQYISLQDAALLSGKSPQTIRRFIKGNKVRYRKYKTPQGFTYLVEKTSLLNRFESEEEMPETNMEEAELVEENEPIEQIEPQPIHYIPAQERRPPAPEPPPPPPGYAPGTNGMGAQDHGFQPIMSQLIQQHRDDKKRLFELLEIFQKRILILEDQIKQLEPPKAKKRRFLFF